MVIPLGGGGLGGGGGMPEMDESRQQCPESVKDGFQVFWWMLSFVLMLATIGLVLARDLLGALVSGVITFWCYWMTKEKCQNMGQCHLLLFGVMCLVQGIFHLLPLGGAVGGRTTEEVTQGKETDSTVSWTTTEETHSFFDRDQGLTYNIQSAMMIASAVSMFLGAFLTYVTYKQYPNALFDDAGQQPLAGGSGGSGYGAGAGSGGGGHAGGNSGNNFGGGRLGGQSQGGMQAFSGAGQRLGS